LYRYGASGRTSSNEKILNDFNESEEKMKVRLSENWLQFAVVLFCLVFSACNALQVVQVGETQTESQSVDLGAASSAEVLIEMDAGRLTMGGGAGQLMQASFRYNVEDWQPQVVYTVNGSQGELTINQPSAQDRLVGSNVVNEWDINLSDSVPLDVEIHTGAGEANLDLSTLDLSNIQVEIGAGETNLDLTSSWDHNVNAIIKGGVGKLTVKLPSDMGVQVNAAAGLGNVRTSGLNQEAGRYVNQAFGSAPYTLTLDIQTGVGSIELDVQ
jgi:hypothetical protein